MKVGYFSIMQNSSDGKINWEKITGQPIIEKGKYFRHVRFQKPLLIRMDGKKGLAVITMNRQISEQ
jgi:hypothetical protein